MSRKDPALTERAQSFKKAISALGWSYTRAAVELGIHSRQRASDFANGERKVPPYIMAHLTHRLDQFLKRKGL